jgi:hypothetical protein
MRMRRAVIPQQYDVQVVPVPDGDPADGPRVKALERVAALEALGYERFRTARRGWFGAESGSDYYLRRPRVGYSRGPTP